jgi:hypothetical protein
MVEWWNGGMVEWWNGGMVEWWNDSMSCTYLPILSLENENTFSHAPNLPNPIFHYSTIPSFQLRSEAELSSN